MVCARMKTATGSSSAVGAGWGPPTRFTQTLAGLSQGMEDTNHPNAHTLVVAGPHPSPTDRMRAVHASSSARLARASSAARISSAKSPTLSGQGGLFSSTY